LLQTDLLFYTIGSFGVGVSLLSFHSRSINNSSSRRIILE